MSGLCHVENTGRSQMPGLVLSPVAWGRGQPASPATAVPSLTPCSRQPLAARLPWEPESGESVPGAGPVSGDRRASLGGFRDLTAERGVGSGGLQAGPLRPGGGLGVGCRRVGGGHIWGEINKLKSVLWACAVAGGYCGLEAETCRRDCHSSFRLSLQLQTLSAGNRQRLCWRRDFCSVFST